MAIEFHCQSCQTTLRVPDGSAGKMCECPKCKIIQKVVESPAIAVPLGTICVVCPECSHNLFCKSELEGTKGFCKQCGSVFTISQTKTRTESILRGPIFLCPECKEVFQGTEEMAGKKGRCSKCHHVFVIELTELAKPAPTFPKTETQATTANTKSLPKTEPWRDQSRSDKPRAGQRPSSPPPSNDWLTSQLPPTHSFPQDLSTAGNDPASFQNVDTNPYSTSASTSYGFPSSFGGSQVRFDEIKDLALRSIFPAIFYYWFIFIAQLILLAVVELIFRGLIYSVRYCATEFPDYIDGLGYIVIAGFVVKCGAAIAINAFFLPSTFLIAWRSVNKQEITFEQILDRNDLILPVFSWYFLYMFFSAAMGGMLVMPFLLLGLLKIPVAVMVAMAIPIGLIVMAILVRFLPPFLLAPFGIVADEGVIESLERSNKIFLKNFTVYLLTLLILMLLMPFVIIFSLGILSPVPLFFLAAMFKLGQRTAKAI